MTQTTTTTNISTIRAPTGRKSYDNALAESINGLYKTEVIRRRGPWRNVDAVELATAEWVDWSPPPSPQQVLRRHATRCPGTGPPR